MECVGDRRGSHPDPVGLDRRGGLGLWRLIDENAKARTGCSGVRHVSHVPTRWDVTTEKQGVLL